MNNGKLLDLERNAEDGTAEEREGLLVKSKSSSQEEEERQVAELIHDLFIYGQCDPHHQPLTSPELPPERRFKRHRNYYIYQLNQFVSK